MARSISLTETARFGFGNKPFRLRTDPFNGTSSIIPFLLTKKRTLSPGFRCSFLRIFTGIVVCPLVVIVDVSMR